MALKGYIWTFDSLLALMLAILVFILISNQLFEPRIPRSLHLRQISQDVLTVLEKDYRMNSFIDDINSSEIREVLRLTEESVCIRLELVDQIGINKSIIKQGCIGTSEEIQVSFRFYTRNDKNYYIKSYAWYRR